jgi:hypothetical protein
VVVTMIHDCFGWMNCITYLCFSLFFVEEMEENGGRRTEVDRGTKKVLLSDCDYDNSG